MPSLSVDPTRRRKRPRRTTWFLTSSGTIVIARSSVPAAVLPASPLQAEIAEQDGRQQEGDHGDRDRRALAELRSEEHTSELQSLMRISYAVFCLKNTIEMYQN